MISYPLTFIFIGKSGCGKGTQATLLTEKIKLADSREIFRLETGRRFREFVMKDSYSARLARKVNAEGGLQPEFMAVWLWSSQMIESMKENQHVIIDGSPRRYHEAGVIDSALRFYGRKSPIVVYIHMSDETARIRMANRKRKDDTDEDINRRLEWFHKDVIPTVEYYRMNPYYRFVEVDGEFNFPEIHKSILQKLHDIFLE